MHAVIEVPVRSLLKVEQVSSAVRDLQGRRIHNHFPGYLCLKWESRRQQRLDGLKPRFGAFFDEYLLVPGAPPGYRWYKPFRGRGRPEEWWLNNNIAGSYAPKSLRDSFSGFVEVIGDEEEGATYSLLDQHWEGASSRLLYGSRLSVVSLAAYLYRDSIIETRNAPSARDLVAIFREEFGYPSSADGREEFTSLFDDRGAEQDTSSWFDVVGEDE